jgi:hypothetical protein
MNAKPALMRPMILVMIAALCAAAAPPSPAPSLEEQSPAFRQLVPAGAQVRTIAEGFT